MHIIHISHICSTWSGLRMPWTLTLLVLLSRGITGKAKEVYEVSWYSYRKRVILSGRTKSTAYLPISPALPCKTVSHLKALWYPRMWLPPPARLCLRRRRTFARFHMLIRMPPISLRGQQQLQFLLRMTRTTRLSSDRDPGRDDANPGILPDVAYFAYGEHNMHILHILHMVSIICIYCMYDILYIFDIFCWQHNKSDSGLATSRWWRFRPSFWFCQETPQ